MKDKPMATELDAPDLLRSAARLIERALIQLDVRESNCLECGTRQFRNLAHAKVYEVTTDKPRQLQEAASRLENVPGGFVPVAKGRD